MLVSIQNLRRNDAPESILQAYSAQQLPTGLTGAVESLPK